MNKLVRALRFFQPDAARVAVIVGILIAGIGANLLKPWPVALLVDSVLSAQKPLPAWLRGTGEASHPSDLVLLLAGLVLILHLAQGTFSATHNYLAIQVGLRGLRRVRNEMFACLQRLSLRFHHGARAGDLIQRAAWDTYAFQTFFQQGLITALAALLSLVLMLVVMWRLNPMLTLVALGTVPLLVITLQVLGRKMTQRGLAAQQADSQVTSHLQQSIAALPLIQSYTLETHEQEEFTARTAAAQAKRLSQHGWELLFWLSITTLLGLGTAGLVWAGVGSPGTELEFAL